MTDKQLERAIQFLLDNQAGHDARISRIEEIVERLGQKQEVIQAQQETAQAQQEEMRTNLYAGLREMHEGIDRLTEIVERTSGNIQKVYELEIQSRQRLGDHESRLVKLEEVQDLPV